MKPGKRATFDVWFDANNITSTVEEYENIEITDADLKKILELAKDPWVHEKIIRSIAPGIHGLEHVKEAVMLMLVGGSDKTISGGMKLRGISHVLLIGDPGLGKSQILKYAQSISPRGIYTSGKGSSAAGLTASVLRDSETGEFTLEAGAIVLADKGLACIDEFDKMRNEDRSSIHEMMEQNTVSIAKAGIVATLNARTSILAAANPKMGRYEAKRTASENINLEPTILSRFDLIFVMADVPDPDTDRERAQHILSLHRGGLTADKLPPVDTDFLRKYIAYSKEHSHPVLSEDASRRIEEYYLEMREMSTGGAAIAITARQLEALVRLTEARARVAIREEATIEDAEAAIKLFRRSLEEVGIDPETGEYDIDILTTGTTKSKRSKIETVIDAIEELSGNIKKAVTITQIVKKCEGSGLTEDYVKEMVDELIHRGQLYQPELGKVKLP
jgi:replicative DNA helicase Mcm